ncbi:hypothetical protein ASG90_17735 [Nocardioides sp. Soil797]|nr:hypothetical protein ASG90_17735 [Nocardioides sp. Soil797]
MSDTGERRHHVVGALLAMTGLLAALLLVTWSASIGPSDVLKGPGTADRTPDTGETPSFQQNQPSPEATPPVRRDTGTDSEDTGPDWVLSISTAAAIVILGLVGWFLLTSLRQSAERRRARARADEQIDFTALPTVGTITDHASEQRHELATGGTPRNAIVACWDRLEHDIANSGIPRRRWETSTEFVLRFLGELDPDPAAARRLAALYREARHSAHPMTEQDRQRALADLDLLHRSLASRSR